MSLIAKIPLIQIQNRLPEPESPHLIQNLNHPLPPAESRCSTSESRNGSWGTWQTECPARREQLLSCRGTE